MAAKTLDQCDTGGDFMHYAEHHGAHVRRTGGSHVVVSVPGCPVQTVVPLHELGKGLRGKIIKAFITMGLGALVLAAYSLLGI